VMEIAEPSPGLSLAQHFKVSSVFRIMHLATTFKTVMTRLKQAQASQENSPQVTLITQQALELGVNILQFDPRGFAVEDESSFEHVDLPRAMQSQMEDESLLQVLFALYQAPSHEWCEKVLEFLLPLACVRWTLFSTRENYFLFMTRLYNGLLEILRSQLGLDDAETHHRFCCLLAAVTSNVRLSEIHRSFERIAPGGFQEFITRLAEFSFKSFGRWELSGNSIHYLLQVWADVIVAVQRELMDHQEAAAGVNNFVPQVVEAYLKGRLDCVEAEEAGVADKLLDDTVWQQLEHLPTICRHVYQSVGPAIGGLLENMARQYQQALASGAPEPQRRIVEGKLAFLVNAVGAIIGGHYSVSTKAPYSHPMYSYALSHTQQTIQPGDEIVDADLSKCVLQLMDLLGQKAEVRGPGVAALESAILYYLSNLKYALLYCDEASQETATYYSRRPARRAGDSAPLPNEIPLRIFERMGLGDHHAVMRMVVTKLISNLTKWADNDDVLKKTLQLFLDLAMGSQSGKLLLELDVIHNLVKHHSQQPFLQHSANSHHRSTFYLALMELLLHNFGDGSALEQFLSPLVAILKQLQSVPNLRDGGAAQAIVGVCRDLQGVVAGAAEADTYNVVFRCLRPEDPNAVSALAGLARAAEELYDNPVVIKAVLKLVMELVYDNGSRLAFHLHSSNGVVLFRESCSILSRYSHKACTLPSGDDAYATKYKAARLCFDVLGFVMEGKYVNFGVMDFYGDTTLHNTLDGVFRLGLSIPFTDMQKYAKVGLAFYHFIESLFRNYLMGVVLLETPLFLSLLKGLQEGLASTGDPRYTVLSASCLNHLATFLFQNMRKAMPAMDKLRTHLSQAPGLFVELLEVLFNRLIFDDQADVTALSQAILTLALADQDSFVTCSQRVASQQGAGVQGAVTEAFQKLMSGIKVSLSHEDRTEFLVALDDFRKQVRTTFGLGIIPAEGAVDTDPLDPRRVMQMAV